MWQPRYKSSRTSSLCGPLLCVCGHCICVSVLCVLRYVYVSTLWQPRYKSSRTSSLCVPCVDIAYACLFCVCYDMCTCLFRVCGSVHLCVHLCWNLPLISASFFLFALLTVLLLPYHAACITPRLKLSSSLLCGSHGTTAVAQQSLCGPLLCLCVCHDTCKCDMCYCCCILVLYKENKRVRQQEFLLATTYYTAAHAPCFLQHKL